MALVHSDIDLLKPTEAFQAVHDQPSHDQHRHDLLNGLTEGEFPVPGSTVKRIIY